MDPRIHGLDIGVSVLNAVVTLTGSVRSPAAKDAAEEIALRIHGVRTQPTIESGEGITQAIHGV